MFGPRYFAFHYYASRYFPPVGILVGDVSAICSLNMTWHVGSLNMSHATGSLNVSHETGSLNVMVRCN